MKGVVLRAYRAGRWSESGGGSGPETVSASIALYRISLRQCEALTHSLER